MWSMYRTTFCVTIGTRSQFLFLLPTLYIYTPISIVQCVPGTRRMTKLKPWSSRQTVCCFRLHITPLTGLDNTPIFCHPRHCRGVRISHRSCGGTLKHPFGCAGPSVYLVRNLTVEKNYKKTACGLMDRRRLRWIQRRTFQIQP